MKPRHSTYKTLKTRCAVMAAAMVLCAAEARTAQAQQASPAIYTEINLSRPLESRPLVVLIRSIHSRTYGWKAGQKVSVRVYARAANGTDVPVKDEDGRDVWIVRLDQNAEAVLSFRAQAGGPTGRLVLTGNSKELFEPRPGGLPDRVLENVLEHRFEDGAGIKVHFTEPALAAAGEGPDFAKQVLAAAVSAYETITGSRGFSTAGYTFADPDIDYAHDPDRTIDVYLGPPDGGVYFSNGSSDALSFKDAPCFDTLRAGDNAYQAVILLPANYKEFIRGWEKINPSSLGERRVGTDLKGTLIHEMLHVIVFYYNKNLNREAEAPTQDKRPASKRKIDWYVEGLARYFETFAGARHDFYSHGFKQTLPDKVRFSRGGSNYFMRYPDQAFTELRYENALFWRFIDYRYGMDRIERLSRDFRGTYGMDFKEALERVTGLQFAELLRQFSLAILFKDLGLKEDGQYLQEIATTRLVYWAGQLHLKDGFGALRPLGDSCATDWIGSWGEAKAVLGQASVAGDPTERADVSAWATDFVEILPRSGEIIPWIGVEHIEGGSFLSVQIAVRFRDGSVALRELRGIAQGSSAGLDLSGLVAAEGLAPNDVQTVHVLVTNTDDQQASVYSLHARRK